MEVYGYLHAPCALCLMKDLPVPLKRLDGQSQIKDFRKEEHPLPLSGIEP
jgi:hypothetical protein